MDYLDIAMSVLAVFAFGVLAVVSGTAWAWIAFGIWVVALVSQLAYLFFVVKKE